MPVIEVTLMEGYPEMTRQALSERLTDAVTETIAAPLDGVTVIIHEVPAANYMRGRQRRVPGVAKPGATQASAAKANTAELGAAKAAADAVTWR